MVAAITRIESNLDGLPAGLEISSQSGPRDSFVWLLVEINAFSACSSSSEHGASGFVGLAESSVVNQTFAFDGGALSSSGKLLSRWKIRLNDVGGWVGVGRMISGKLGSWVDGCNFGLVS